MDVEKRFIDFRSVDPEGGDIRGVVMPYGSRATIGKYTEEFRAGVFTAGLGDAIVNLQHDRTRPVARIDAGLELMDGDKALEARIQVPDTPYGREARELVKANILRGFSVEFRAIDQEWNGLHRTVNEAHLVAIGLVDRPAYSDAQIQKRFEEVYGHYSKSWVRYYY